MHLHPVTPADRPALLAVATATGLFSAAEAESLLGGILDALASGDLPDGSTAVACRLAPDGPVCGWTYVAPDAHAEGVWNLWWLGVEPSAHGSSAGTMLLRDAEARALANGARLMIIETSAKDSQARARRFYAREGYADVGRIPEFYGPGDDKVIFFRHLASGRESGAPA